MNGCQIILLMGTLVDKLDFIKGSTIIYGIESIESSFYEFNFGSPSDFHKQLAEQFARDYKIVDHQIMFDEEKKILEIIDQKNNQPWYVQASQKGGNKKRKPFIK